MRILLVAVVGMALIGASKMAVGQMPQPMPAQQPPPGPRLGGPPLGAAEPVPAEMQEEQARARSNERQRRLVADTDKLLALATELKQDVSKTNKDVLSVDVVKKADEIEKLARSVKERMKG